MKLNYNDLSPKGKFIRSCVYVPLFLLLLFGFFIYLSAHFTLSGRFIIKYIVVSVISVFVGIAQLVGTYIAWKRDDSY